MNDTYQDQLSYYLSIRIYVNLLFDERYDDPKIQTLAEPEVREV